MDTKINNVNKEFNLNLNSEEKENKTLDEKIYKSESNDDSDNNSSDDSDYDQEFTCDECETTQGVNACELCNNVNICEECYGQGGDYGPNEIWVCNDCLPTCLKCNSKLYCAFDECCGEGRSDIPLEIQQS